LRTNPIDSAEILKVELPSSKATGLQRSAPENVSLFGHTSFACESHPPFYRIRMAAGNLTTGKCIG
jgi:hypothetical protein